MMLCPQTQCQPPAPAGGQVGALLCSARPDIPAQQQVSGPALPAGQDVGHGMRGEACPWLCAAAEPCNASIPSGSIPFGGPVLPGGVGVTSNQGSGKGPSGGPRLPRRRDQRPPGLSLPAV